jgi:hypothetical protein
MADDAALDEGLGLVYRVRLAMDKDFIMAGGLERRLKPGMEVSAEIATGKRRLIGYVLDPLLSMGDEASGSGDGAPGALAWNPAERAASQNFNNHYRHIPGLL